MEEIKVYLIARISEDAHPWNNEICSQIKKPIDVFKPQDHNPWNKQHETFSKNVFEIDLKAMEDSHFGLALPEFGSDCSWECGWYSNSHKPLIFFVDTQLEWLRNWMVKGGISYVTTNNKETFKILKKDPILKSAEIILIKQISDLNEVIKKLYVKHYEHDKKVLS